MRRITYITEYVAWKTPNVRIPAITGISKKVYDFLSERPLLSLEIKSADNIRGLLSIEKGHYIFLTPVLRDDLFLKAQGLVCIIEDMKVSIQKVKKWDEVEVVAVRIQVKPVCEGRIRSFERKPLGEGVEVEVERTVRGRIS